MMNRLFDPRSDHFDLANSRLYRSAWNGWAMCLDLKEGAVLWEKSLPWRCIFHPAAGRVIAGCGDGSVCCLNAEDGSLLWRTRLPDIHEPPTGDFASYVRAAEERDAAVMVEHFTVGDDRPGEYDHILRFGIEQLQNGDFEEDSGWSAEGRSPSFASPGYNSQRCLRLAAGEVIAQTVGHRLVPLGTYLLEFFYRGEKGNGTLTAGGLLQDGKSESVIGTTFSCRPGEWRFARVPIKVHAATTVLQIGFEAGGDGVMIDCASLRPVRFPSANLLANTAIHAVEPTFVRDSRVQYHRIPPNLKQGLLKENRATAFKQGETNTATRFSEEEAFLHNGRLDDVGARWVYEPDAIGFSVTLTKPAWISHVVMYLANHRPEDAYRTIAVVAFDFGSKTRQVAALVRGNRRRFVVAHFPQPILTDSLQILPAFSPRAHHECLTEIEVYGPVGGPDSSREKKFPDDPLAYPMFMGSPSHAPAAWPAELVGDYCEIGRTHNLGAPVFGASAIAASGQLILPTPGGGLQAIRLTSADPKLRLGERCAFWSMSTISIITTPAWYAGRLLAGSADGCLHAVAENGTRLWSFKTGGRIYSSPTPAGDDVFCGSDDGSLYKIDIDSGILLWEYKTDGKIRAAPALADGVVYAASWDGYLHAVAADTGQRVWRAAIAPHTRAAAAVHKGLVAIGDEAGYMRAFQANDGQEVFSHRLGGRISACPLFTAEGIVFLSEQGHIAMVDYAGALVWSRQLTAEISGQAVATISQAIIPTRQGVVFLRLSDGQSDDRLRLPARSQQVLAALPYGERLAILYGSAETIYGQGPVTYADYQSEAVIYEPEKK